MRRFLGSKRGDVYKIKLNPEKEAQEEAYIMDTTKQPKYPQTKLTKIPPNHRGGLSENPLYHTRKAPGETRPRLGRKLGTRQVRITNDIW